MSIIVTDTGFAADDFTGSFTPLAEMTANTTAVDLTNIDDPTALADHLGHITAIRIAFPAFSDGRGFTLGRRLRMMGYLGRLRAHGHVISDQYAMARRTGFDEVEISDDLATRQPAEQWIFRADWQDHHYQSRLRA